MTMTVYLVLGALLVLSFAGNVWLADTLRQIDAAAEEDGSWRAWAELDSGWVSPNDALPPSCKMEEQDSVTGEWYSWHESCWVLVRVPMERQTVQLGMWEQDEGKDLYWLDFTGDRIRTPVTGWMPLPKAEPEGRAS